MRADTITNDQANFTFPCSCENSFLDNRLGTFPSLIVDNCSVLSAFERPRVA